MSGAPVASCLNCGTPLAGAYCHRCGQDAADRRVPLGTLFRDALGDLLAFDSRILRTLRPLFLRPGHLTAEWCRGRRVPYVPPLRLYVFVGAIFFLVLAFTDVQMVQIDTGDAAEEATNLRVTATRGEPGATGDGVFDRYGERLFTAWEADPQGVQDRFLDRLGRLSLLLAPLFALLLVLVYRNRRRFLVEHVVFALHFHVFAYLVLAVAALVERAGPLEVVAAVLRLATLPYLYLALRRVYGGRRWVTAARTAALVLAYFLVVMLPTMMLAFVWTAATV